MVSVYMYIDNGLYLSAYILTIIDIHEDPYLMRLGFAYAGRSSVPGSRLLIDMGDLE